MSGLSYNQINDDVLGALKPPRKLYYVVIALLAAVIAYMFSVWTYQVRTGMGVAGISHPVGWGVYIANFVFWVGIAHSGTLISAILHLVRARWRAAVSRSAEAMTVFAVMTAGLFPLVHLGRLWVVYFIFPYPSQRQLWPNFMSPLVWDVVAVSTYLTVSVIFFFVGLVPDLAAARDRSVKELGAGHFRSRLYERLSLGWTGAGGQWHHYGRAYLFFAALATPLVVSVHSVVSWDFAMGILPGWHTTIFPPYFVAGAIHSGLAMVLTLLIPMRKLLKLDRIITIDHFDAIGRTMIVTTLIVGYAYVIEPFISWYSGDLYEQQFAWWRATGWMAVWFWALVPLNVLFPLLLIFKRVRRSIAWLFVISILVNMGMWSERFVIIVASTSHDFLPHNWGQYAPTWVEISITLGSFCFFLFWFFGFTKLLPTIPANELKEQIGEAQVGEVEMPQGLRPRRRLGKVGACVMAVFSQPRDLVEAIAKVRQSRFERLEYYSPIRLDAADAMMAPRFSPVRLWTLGGALAGLTGGFSLAIGSALVNGLIVGGKPPVSILPYCVIGFEGTILLGVLGNLTGMLVHARLGRKRLPPHYDGRFSVDKFGLLVACEAGELPEASALVNSTKPQEVHVYDR